MKRRIQFVLLIVSLLAVMGFTALYLSGQNIAVLNPKGTIAIQQRQLLIDATLWMLIVVIPVFILTLAFMWKYRASNDKAKYTPDWEHSHLAECFWWGVPFIIIIILAVITWKSSYQLNPYKPIVTGKKPMTIQVVALNWKWLFIYPEQGIATINYVEFPVQTPIVFEITADAPMNSFWIPQLGGQIYAMPAMKTKLHLIANEMGNFRGSSANISGDGFAGMVFTAKATAQEDFNQWVQSVRQSSQELNIDEYNVLVEPSAYNPVATYVLIQPDLFDRIIMKYTMPPK